MPNNFVFTDWLAMEALRTLVNPLVVAENFNTDYNKEFTKEFAVGETVRVKNPQRFTVRDGMGYNPQGLNRTFTTVTVDQAFGIDFEWDSIEQALKLERPDASITQEYIQPAMLQLSQEIDSRAAKWAYENTNNTVGILGTNAVNTDIAGAARQKLIENSCPPGDRVMIVSPGQETSIVNGSTTIFNPTSEISQQYKEGSMGKARGFDWYSSMSLYNHTAGTWAGVVEITTGGISGSAQTVTCTAGDKFNKGDIFNIAGVFNVNPKTRRSTGDLKQFVVTQTATAAGTTQLLHYSPAIVGPGDQYQNVSALPAGGADLTLFPGTTTPNGKSGTQGLALHKDAFALVGVKLALPRAVEVASQARDPKTGIAVRFVRQFDAEKSKMVNRFDVLLGFGNLYPDNCAVRVLGK